MKKKLLARTRNQSIGPQNGCGFRKVQMQILGKGAYLEMLH